MKAKITKQPTEIHARSGTPRMSSIPMIRIDGARFWALRPPEIATTRPRTQMNDANVTMKADIPTRTTKNPFRKPMIPPTARAIAKDTTGMSQAGSKATPMPTPLLAKSIPVTMADRAAVDSTDRSRFPAMITIASPIAITPTKVDCSKMLAKIPNWK